MSIKDRPYLIDPLQIDCLLPLKQVFLDPGTVKILHAGDYDVRSLDRDFDFQFRNIFDTSIAASFVGSKRLGLDAVLKELEKKQFTRNTSDRQQRILSRMLDSQKSMTTKGFEEERRSETAKQVAWTGPSGMPADLGQRQSLIINAMNTALKSGYSRNYQNMIRRYFNKLSESETVLLPDSTQTPTLESNIR